MADYTPMLVWTSPRESRVSYSQYNFAHAGSGGAVDVKTPAEGKALKLQTVNILGASGDQVDLYSGDDMTPFASIVLPASGHFYATDFCYLAVDEKLSIDADASIQAMLMVKEQMPNWMD